MITIKTRLHDGIYKSNGGGEVVCHYKYNTNGRNLLKAIRVLFEHRAAMVRNYGNIGAGSSWMEIDEVFVEQHDLEHLSSTDLFWFSSRTARASALIRRLQNQKETA